MLETITLRNFKEETVAFYDHRGQNCVRWCGEGVNFERTVEELEQNLI